MTRIFSFIFFSISLWIGMSSILSEVVAAYDLSYYFHYVIWTGSFFLSVLLFIRSIITERKVLRDRFSKSISWPNLIKLINGLSWALPFIMIPFFQKYYPILLITGLSLGNISTFIFLKRYSKLFSIEQMTTGLILAISLFGIVLYNKYYDNYEGTLLFTRVMISVSYGLGGLTGYFTNRYKDE